MSAEHKGIVKERLISWRKESVMVKVEKPTRLDRAHSLGYKAKKGFVIIRARIKKGTRKRETPSGGRKPLKQGRTRISHKMSLQHIVEMRVAKKHPNMEVLNSYYVAEDGQRKWFEVILVDPMHPCIKGDKKLNWICDKKRRVFRGLTSNAKKARSLKRGFERRSKPAKK